MSGIDANEALRWLEFADDDLAVAKTIKENRQLPGRLACFHCQQAAEKAIKALLIFHNIDFPRTHDLNLLLRLVKNGSPLKTHCPDLTGLIVFAAEARYPGDYPDATTANVNDAVITADRVLELVRAEIR